MERTSKKYKMLDNSRIWVDNGKSYSVYTYENETQKQNFLTFLQQNDFIEIE